ncbi:MAG: hypothetical protein KBB01_02475 [Candidatus Omnitrophica bacterium]|jgi:hypothetical protein|nr:hypothetical protein [Candidatus Omnitrophota bacterium]
MNKVLKSIQFFVLKTNRIWPFNKLYTYSYILARYVIVNIFKKLQQILSIYVKGAVITALDIPGSSDIDLTLITENLNPEKEFLLLKIIYKRFKILNRIFPFFSHYRTLNITEARVYSQLKTLKGDNILSSRSKCVYGSNILESKFQVSLDNIDLLNKSIDTLKYLNWDLFTLDNNRHLRHFIKRIDTILEYLKQLTQVEHYSEYLRDLEKQSHLIKEANYFTRNSEDLLLDLWTKAIFLVNSFCACSKSPTKLNIDNKKLNRNFVLTKYDFAQETEEKVFNLIKPFIDEIATTSKETKGVLLWPKINTNYQYNIVVFLPNNLDFDKAKNIISYLVYAYRKIKLQNDNWYFGPPLVGKEDMIKFYIGNITSPLGIVSLIRHGKLLYNNGIIVDKNLKEILQHLNSITPQALIGSVLLGPPLGVNIMEPLIKAIDTKNLKKVISHLDTILGVIPAKRLMLEKEIITTSPKETYLEYIDKFKTELETQFYRRNYQKFYFDITRKSFLSEVKENLSNIHKFLRLNTNSILNYINKIINF